MRDDHDNRDDVGDPAASIRELRRRHIQLHFFRCNYTTDKMMKLLTAEYRAAGRRESSKLRLRTHNLGSDPKQNFLMHTVNSITESVSVTLDRTHGQESMLKKIRTKSAFRPTLLSALLEAADEDADEAGGCGRAEVPSIDDARFPRDDEIVEVYTAIEDGGHGGKKPSSSKTVYLDSKPFATGALRAL